METEPKATAPHLDSTRILNRPLIERTQSGIIRAKAAGKRFGRRPSLNVEQKAVVLERLDAGDNVAKVAREFKTTRQTIMRVRAAALKLSATKEERSCREIGNSVPNPMGI